MFRLAAREIGMPEFTQKETLLAFLDECAQAIADGEPNLRDLLDTIHLNSQEDYDRMAKARNATQSKISN